jgi:hypothetical protein
MYQLININNLPLYAGYVSAHTDRAVIHHPTNVKMMGITVQQYAGMNITQLYVVVPTDFQFLSDSCMEMESLYHDFLHRKLDPKWQVVTEHCNSIYAVKGAITLVLK